MGEPFRVLQVVTKMDRAGLETMLMNYYRHIDREKIQFDFLTHRQEEGAYDAEILSLGGRIYCMPAIAPASFFEYKKALKRFFIEHNEYRIVHSHLDALSAFVLKAAQEAGIPTRIAHSHNNGFDRDWKLPLRYAAKSRLTAYATQFWGCSRDAVRFLFGNVAKYYVLKNAIDTAAYMYSENTRAEYRKQLGIDGCFTVGHVGRFSYQKNHEFLLEVFFEIKKKQPEAKLLLVGAGALMDRVKEETVQHGVDDSVIFLGSRNDVPQLMQAMDVFLLPSHFEGLGVVLIEAQAAGLKCVASDTVAGEADVTGNTVFLPLSNTPESWADAVANSKSCAREGGASAVAAAGYDINLAAQELANIYSELVK